MKLLIIEDETAITLALRRALRMLYVIDVATTGMDGIHEAEVNTYDTILLDLSLPDMEGIEICKELRKQRIATPILVLTARANIEDKVMLLDAGADDYLTKPFSLEELKARLRVLSRREVGGNCSSAIVVGDLKLNTATREAWRSDLPIALRRKEYDLLLYLMRHSGTVVTRAMIIDRVWAGNENLWTNAVDVHIKYLRDKIDRPFGSTLIKTVHGVGYKFEVTKAVAVFR